MMPQVSELCYLFNETRSDRQSKEVLGEITDYNRRYSGAPRRVSSTLSDLLIETVLTVLHPLYLCGYQVMPLSPPPFPPLTPDNGGVWSYCLHLALTHPAVGMSVTFPLEYVHNLFWTIFFWEIYIVKYIYILLNI